MLGSGKTLIFSDIHFGIHNKEKYLNICIDTMNWIIDVCKKQNIENVIFMGDFFNNRSFIDVKILSYASKTLNELSKTVKSVYMIVGNHDIYLKDSTDINSLEEYKGNSNIHIIDKPYSENSFMLIPWGYGKTNDNLNIPNGIKFVFMHHEFPKSIYFDKNNKKEIKSDTSSNDRYDDLDINQSLINEVIKNKGIIFSGHIHHGRRIPISQNSYILITGSPYETEWGFNNLKCGIFILENNHLSFIENLYNKHHIEILASQYSEQIKNINCEKSIIRLKVDQSNLSNSDIKDILNDILKHDIYMFDGTLFDFSKCQFSGDRDETENPPQSIDMKTMTPLKYSLKMIDDIENLDESIDKNELKKILTNYHEKRGLN